jgi:hypothetical protein
MKRSIIAGFISLLMTVGLHSNHIRNQDSPLRGNWDFKIKSIWVIENYGLKPIASIGTFRIDSRGFIFIFDKKYGKFYVLDSSGEYKFSFGRYGEGPGEYMKMLKFFLVDKLLIVYDLNRLVYFNSSGKFLKNVRLNRAFNLNPLFFLDSNNFIFTPKTYEQIVPRDKICQYNLITNKVHLIVNPRLSNSASKINKSLRRNHLTVSNENLRSIYPGLIVGRSNDKIIWGNNGKYLINIIGLDSKEYFSFGIDNRAPNRIPVDLKKDFLPKNMTGHPLPKPLISEYLNSIPDHSTFFSRITTTKKGHFYIYVANAIDRGNQQIDIFSREGQYFYRAEPKFPKNMVIKRFQFNGDFVYASFEDKYQNINFGKFTISKPKL